MQKHLANLQEGDGLSLVPAVSKHGHQSANGRSLPHVTSMFVLEIQTEVQTVRQGWRAMRSPVRGGGDAASVVHLGGVGEHGGSHARGREAGGLRAANAVVRGLWIPGERQETTNKPALVTLP